MSWWDNMYFVEIQEKQLSLDLVNHAYVKIFISVDVNSLFGTYLKEQLARHPLFIAFNKRLLHAPIPYIEAFPNEISIRNKILLNEPITIELPTILFERHFEKTVESLVHMLLDWIEESYSIFQNHWKNSVYRI